MLEEKETSIRPTKPLHLSPYNVDEGFQRRSYVERYELTCLRLVRDRLYDAACFITSHATTGKKGRYREPNAELSVKNFAISLRSRAAAFAQLGDGLKVLEGGSDE